MKILFKNPITNSLILAFLVMAIISSCSKKDSNVTPVTVDTTATADKIDIRDSAYYYSLIYYLWAKNLPDYSKWNTTQDLILNSQTTFKPHDFSNLDSIMSGQSGIRKYSDKNSSGKNLDRYSFAYTQTAWESTASGSNVGFGFSRGYLSETDQRVIYVFKNSPIGKAGVKRGWKILKVNGITATYTNESSVSASISNNSTTTFVFGLPDASQKEITITKASYTANYVLQDTIITSGDSKIGYVVLNSFLGDSTENNLTKAVNNLKSGGITDLVVDLRYNGGGYTSISEFFADLVAPSTAKGKLMYSYVYNTLITNYYASQGYTSTVKFDNSAANFNLSRIVFITAEGTASASELMINNLKPYMTVKLVGSTTYGKPVGFPAILIQMSKTDKSKNYYIFPIAFKTVNANNQSDYFNGMTVDSEQSDDFTKDWGDVTEPNFKAAISYLTTGSFARTGSSDASVRIAKIKSLNQSVSNENHGGINGMISSQKLPFGSLKK